MELKIYTSKGAVRHTTDTTRKESSRVQQLMNDNYVQIVLDHTEELGFKAGDNITFKGEKFTLIQDYKAEVKNEYEYHYELKFEGPEGYFKTLPFFHYITNGNQTEKEPEVNYTATLAMTAEMAVTSLRKASGDDTWQVGTLAEGDESKYLNFSADSVFDAFGKIADEFKTEWWIEGNKVNFSRCERGDLQTFSAKSGGGLSSVDIASSNEVVPNRIYAYGSDRNITKKYTAQGLAYNTRLRLPAGIEYVEMTGGAENIISKTVFFDNDEIGNIYPKRVGTISKVEVGGTTEAPVYYFYDKDIDFDPKAQLIEGTTMMVRFESGMLQGRDFELGYNEKLKRFEIINTQEGDIQVPFGSIIPKVGDKYVLWNMEMPQIYITNEENKLLTVAQEYVDNLNKKTPEITCKSFEPYFDEYGKVVTIGSRIKIEDDRLKGGYIESRVTRYSYPLFCESQVEFTLSENVASGRLTQIENKIEDVTADNAQNVQYARAVSRRGWRDAQELTTALEALQAELVLVGNPESQFSCSCVFKSNKNNDPNLLAISAGELQHVVYKGQAGDKWVIEGAEFTLTEDTLYYIYFKCNRDTNKGNVIISQTRLGFESQEGYYLFLGGVVSSIFENARIVNIVSGFTQIAGGNITTERIQDPTGKLIIDLTAVPPHIIARKGAKFIGDFSFESADGLDNITGINDIKSDISEAQKTANKGLDTTAKLLEYSSVDEMITAAGKGETIIKGGHIQTSLIDTDTLIAKNVFATDGSSEIRIMPNEGMKMLENNVVTATFSGAEKSSIDSLVPSNSTRIYIYEKVISSNSLMSSSITTTMATGTVIGSASIPINVTYPSITIFGRMECAYYDTQHPLNSGRFELKVELIRNGIVVGSAKLNENVFNYPVEQGGPWQFDKEFAPITIPSYVDILSTSSYGNVNMSLRYSFTSVDFISPINPTYSRMYIAARFGTTNNQNTPAASQLIQIGGQVLNSSIFGNGVMFSKGINQYAGILSSSDNTEIAIRSGKYGIRCDSDGLFNWSNASSAWDKTQILAQGLCNGSGTMSRTSGILKCTSTKDSQNTFTITHNLGSSIYSIVASAYSMNNYNKYNAVITYFGANSFNLIIFDSGNNTNVAVPFFFQISGQA